LALAGILLQNMSKVLIFADFEFNREYIAKNLCVKKDDPNNSCRGSCHLKKQLDEEDQREQAPANNTFKDNTMQLFCQDLAGLVFVPVGKQKAEAFYSFSVPAPPSFSFLRPPKV
jgi:hypothetical protein